VSDATRTDAPHGDAAPVVDGVTVTLDGTEIVARKGELLIAAAERNGVYIPRFCYHERMRPVGMCRMCIVEVDTGRGPALQPSCMLECTEGMKVDTDSPVTKKAQDGVLEFLLINHPLDCPVCDKGGECPLQDQTVAFGPGESRFVEEKRHVEKPIPISDLVLLDRERCILCDRCTRFADEVAGDPLIHFMHRGSTTEVNTFPDEPFSSYFSGNTIQLCPVGALTSSSYRFKARPWDLEETQSTCQGCSVGCRLAVQSSRDEVLRYVGIDIEPVNWGWLCDKGRFSSQQIGSDERLGQPLLRQGADLAPARWTDAVRAAAGAIRAGLDRSGPEGVAVLGGARLTNESAYAWAKLAKGVIGTDNVDAQLGDGLPAELVLGVPRATIAQACQPGGTVVLLGPDPKEELAVLFLRLRHAVENDGVTVIQISPEVSATSVLASVAIHPRPGEQAAAVRALLDPTAPTAGGVPAELLAEARGRLEAAAPGSVTVVLGRQSLAEDATGVVDAAGLLLAELPEVRFLSALRRGNVHGALDLGLAPGLLPGRVALEDGRSWFADAWPTLPARAGLDATGILQAAADGRIDTLVLVGADPLSDFPDHDLASRALAGARTVVAVDRFLTESSRRADVVLPAAGFAEVEGTTTNLEGRISTVHQRVNGPGSAQADWIIAAELAFQLGTELGLESVEGIQAEIDRLSPAHAGLVEELAAGRLDADGVVFPRPADADAQADATADEATAAEGDGHVEGVPAPEAGEEAVAAHAASDAAEREAHEAAATEAEAGAASDAESADASPAAAAAAADGPEPEGADPDQATAAAPVAPAQLVFVPGPVADEPAHDAYSLRLVATRKLYDEGTSVQRSPAIAHLAPGSPLRVNPYDFERLGVERGSRVRVTSARGTVTAELVVDDGVPRGCASLRFNQPGVRASSLIDATQRVTDVRIERGDG
jgi:NADH-quinone oxidoreductase subunit G